MKENLFEPNKIRTFTGKYINPFDPDKALICIEDIAHCLAHQCRFGGHTNFFYSVAQHSLDVFWEVGICNPELRLAALLHDASEAYLLDIPAPVKSQIPGYKEAEDRLMRVIADKFGFEYPLPALVKDADQSRLVWEWKNTVLSHRGFYLNMTTQTAEDIFLKTFYYLKDTIELKLPTDAYTQSVSPVQKKQDEMNTRR